MQNFQQILTQAAQLKQHQLKKDRKGYQSLPQFLKSGLGYNKKYDLIRKQNFLYQLRISNKVKQQGNSLFKQNKYQQALSRYEEALSVFRYIQSKTYENMKDQDLTYHNYNVNNLSEQLKNKYEAHLCALYLNICSCLTKLNKKQDAIYSADQALKIKKTAKGHYKKAQAYLKYVNRQTNDIKLGILQLKEAYAIEKDPGILKQMYSAKENYQKQQQKSKNWFKFMFDKNKTTQQPKKDDKKEENIKNQQKKQEIQKQLNPQKQKMQKKMKQLQNEVNSSMSNSTQTQKFEQIKQKLRTYLSLSQSKWVYFYQKDYIKRNGSKIYSLLKIFNQQNLAAQFRTKLANCLQSQEMYEKNKSRCQECIQWLLKHPIQQTNKYIQRYKLQTSWIRQNRKSMYQQQGRQQKLNNVEYQIKQIVTEKDGSRNQFKQEQSYEQQMKKMNKTDQSQYQQYQKFIQRNTIKQADIQQLQYQLQQNKQSKPKKQINPNSKTQPNHNQTSPSSIHSNKLDQQSIPKKYEKQVKNQPKFQKQTQIYGRPQESNQNLIQQSKKIKKREQFNNLRKQLQQQFKQQQLYKRQQQLKKQKQQNYKYIAVGVILALLLIRFLWQ